MKSFLFICLQDGAVRPQRGRAPSFPGLPPSRQLPPSPIHSRVRFRFDLIIAFRYGV